MENTKLIIEEIKPLLVQLGEKVGDEWRSIVAIPRENVIAATLLET